MSHLPRIPSLKDPLALAKEEATLFKKTGPLTAELAQQSGSLGNLPAAQGVTQSTTQSICGFCSTGCSLTMHLGEDGAQNLTPTPHYPVNLGMACPKGWEALAVLDAPNRAKTPLLHGKPIDWATAADTFCDRIKEIQKNHGDHSVAFLSTGQIPFEEMAFIGSFFKSGMGGLHCDGNTRQCMATSVVAYKQSFGFDAPPYTYADFEESEHLVFIGANPCIAHPIMWQRVLRNKNSPRISVIDPRNTETAQCATHHYPLKPKSDQALFYGIAHYLFTNNLCDNEFLNKHTERWEEYRTFVSTYDLETTSELSGISPEDIIDLATAIAQKKTSLWWTMGVNQSHQGVRTAQAIINLSLMTGNIGKPGTGANSITGQCNAMGSRLFSNTTNLLGGHDFSKGEHREKISQHTGIPADRIPTELGKPYHEIIEGILNGEIKALWVIATNPAHSWINQNCFKEVREKLEFLVVQDMYEDTETAQVADLILPAAGWGEKTGCFINSERRISTIRPVKTAPGVALADFKIIQLLSHAWGCADLFAKWTSPEAVFHMLRDCTKDTPCDITGITGYQHLEDQAGIQWPYPEGSTNEEPEKRLFTDFKFFTPSQKAIFHFSPPTEVKELPCSEFPFYLNTGRGSSSQWHTQTRTRSSKILQQLSPSDPYIEINPLDAKELEIAHFQWVTVSSKRGKIRVRAYLAPSVSPGHLFLPMHDRLSNQLTPADFDPFSFQPSYKTGAVALSKG